MREKVTLPVGAPAARVWAVLADLESWPTWTPTMSRVRVLSGGGLQVGARVRVSQPRLPPATWSVTEVVPGRSFAWCSTAPGVRTVATHRVEPVDPGTSTVELTVEHSGPFAAALGLVARRLTRRYLDLEARGLQARATG